MLGRTEGGKKRVQKAWRNLKPSIFWAPSSPLSSFPARLRSDQIGSGHAPLDALALVGFALPLPLPCLALRLLVLVLVLLVLLAVVGRVFQASDSMLWLARGLDREKTGKGTRRWDMGIASIANKESKWWSNRKTMAITNRTLSRVTRSTGGVSIQESE